MRISYLLINILFIFNIKLNNYHINRFNTYIQLNGMQVNPVSTQRCTHVVRCHSSYTIYKKNIDITLFIFIIFQFCVSVTQVLVIPYKNYIEAQF